MQMNYCPKCGSKLEENSIICPSCGIELEPEDRLVSLDQSPPPRYNVRSDPPETYQAPRYAPPPPVYRPHVPDKNISSEYGIAGTVLGLISLIPLFTGIIFGILAMSLGGMGRERDESPGASIVAITLGLIGFLIGVFISIFTFVPFYYYPYY